MELHHIKFVAFRLVHHRKSFAWAGVSFRSCCRRLEEQKSYQKTSKRFSFSLNGLVFFNIFCSFVLFFLLLRKLKGFFFFSRCFFFCRFRKSGATSPSGGSQVDIADVRRGGGLILLVHAFSAGAHLRLLVLLLLLPALAEVAQQHALNLLLTLFENVLQ